MTQPLFILTLISLLLGQSAGLSGPFVYCLAEGELCCMGWGAEVCCDPESGMDSGPGLDAAASCSDVEADLLTGLLDLSRRHPGPTPAKPAILPVPSLPDADREAESLACPAGPAPPPWIPHLDSTVLLI